MRITVFGAGAIGGHLAARLAHAGLDVSVVARGAQLEAIQKNGLRFINPVQDFTVRVRARDSAAALGPQDLVISTVKAHSLPAATDSLRALLGPDTPVIYAVNGIPWWYFHKAQGAQAGQQLPRLDPGARLWNDVGVDRAIGCVVQSANEVTAPGVVENRSADNRFILGEPAGDVSPRLARIVEVLQRAVPEIQATADIRHEIWSKLLLNMSTSPLACLTLSTGRTIATEPALQDLFRRTMAEGAQVASALGVAVATDFEARFVRMRRQSHRSSMLQDLLAGRPLEIDGQLAAVQDVARSLGVATPTFDLLLALLVQRARESGLYPSQPPAQGA